MKLKYSSHWMLTVVLIVGTLTSVFAQPVVKLRNLEEAPGANYRIQSNDSGKAIWIMNVSDEINVVLTPIGYVPASFGNTLNLNNVVVDPNGDIWIIDSAGDAVQIGSTTVFSGSWNDLTDIPAGFADGTDNVQDSDSDPTNEIQLSSQVELSSALAINGDVYTDVQSALQAIVNAGVGSGGGFSGSWNDLTNVPAGFADDTDDVDDADADPANEIQQVDTFTLNGTTLGISLSSDGAAQSEVDLSALQDGTGTDDQTAAEVSVSPITNLTATDVQAALAEHQSDIDAFAGGGTDDQTAAEVPITDAGGYFVATDVEAALQEEAVNRIALDQLVGDLITLSGVPITSQNLGTFTGTTITDDNTVKGALQELETAVEAGGGLQDGVVNTGSVSGNELILSRTVGDDVTIDVTSLKSGAVANVVDYGATAGNTGAFASSNTIAFRLARDSGLPIYVPPGEFRINDTINLLDNQTLFGEGRQSRVKTFEDHYMFALGLENTVFGLTLVGLDRNSDSTSQTGIYIDGGVGRNEAMRSIIHDVYFKDLGGAGIHIKNVAWDYSGNMVSSCYAVRCNIGFNLGERGEYTTFSNCHANTCNTGYSIQGGNTNISGGAATNCGVGVDLVRGENDAHGIISGLIANHNTVANVRADSTTLEFNFSSCEFYAGSIILKDVKNYTFTSCHFAVGELQETRAIDNRFYGCWFNESNFSRSQPIDSRNIFQNCNLFGSLPPDGFVAMEVVGGIVDYINILPNYNNKIATTGIDTVDFERTPTGIFNVQVQGSDTIRIAFSNYTESGQYLLHLSGVQDSVVVAPEGNNANPSRVNFESVTVQGDKIIPIYVYQNQFYWSEIAGRFEYGEFDYDQVQGLALWLDPDNASSLTQNAGLDVLEIRDLSGNQRHFTSDALTAPAISTFNGRSVLNFGGTEYMTHENSKGDYNFMFHATQGVAYVVVKYGNDIDPQLTMMALGNNRTSNGNRGFTIGYSDASGNNNRSWNQFTNGSGVAFDYRNNAYIPNVFEVYEIKWDGTGATAADKLDIGVGDTTDVSAPFGTAAPATLDASYDLQLGAGGDNVNPLVGQVGLVLIYNRELTLQERTDIVTKINTDFGL